MRGNNVFSFFVELLGGEMRGDQNMSCILILVKVSDKGNCWSELKHVERIMH